MIMQPQCTYHLAGMNVEAWEHKHPEEGDNPCTEAVWKMVCHTYFPRAQTGCKTNPPEPTKLLRPCKNVCQSYVKACQVQCCDESVECVDTSKVSLVDGTEMETRRYHEESGPSHLCTGAASRQSPGVISAIMAVLALLQLALPGSCREGVSGVSCFRIRPRLGNRCQTTGTGSSLFPRACRQRSGYTILASLTSQRKINAVATASAWRGDLM